MISGIFENCIGTIDAAATLKYWAEFGYQQIQQGQLSAEQAGLLYQHPAALTSWRLQNGDSAAHGLVRIMLWSQPRNAGLGKTLPMVVGSRWFASLTQDIYTIADAFADDTEGGDWIYTEPVRAIEGIGNQGTGLYNRFVGVREMFAISVEDIQHEHQRVSNSSATHVTPIVANEFDEPSFGLVAPDGFYWVIVGK